MVSLKKLRTLVRKDYRDRASNILRRLPVIPKRKYGASYLYDKNEVITELKLRYSKSKLSNEVIDELIGQLDDNKS